MLFIQSIALIGNILFHTLILCRVCKGKSQEAYALMWISGAIVLIISAVSESVLLFSIVNVMGIKTPPFILLTIFLISTALLLFQLILVTSKHNLKINLSVQKIELFRGELSEKNEVA